MKRSIPYLLVSITLLFYSPAWAQGGFGGRRGMGGMGGPGGERMPSAPKLPGVELEGPLDSAMARELLRLSDDQATRYSQAYDSFMVATRPQRDSVTALLAKMNDRLAIGDRAAAMFYVDLVQDLGKYLRDRQDKFEDNLKRFLNNDQVKAYRHWKEGEEQAIESKRREDALRWRDAEFAGAMGGPRTFSIPDTKTAIAPAAGSAAPPLGSQAVRVGRTVYITNQLAVDSSGGVVGADLRQQAERAFANLETVLRQLGASPRDVIALTIYVVNYRSADLATIREAGASYFEINAPIAAVVGVQSVGRDGALISIGATALTPASPAGRER